MGYSGSFRPTDYVTVAYLEISEAMTGGELVVLNKTEQEMGSTPPPKRGAEDASMVLRKVQPKPGLVVDFDGRLLHAVYPYEAPTPRMCAVIEQCKLPRRAFMKTPRFNIYCQKTNRNL